MKELESNEKVQAVVREIKRHMLIHKTQVENEKWSSFTSEYSDAVTNITAAYILCLLDTLAKQGQRFKENPKFDNLVFHDKTVYGTGHVYQWSAGLKPEPEV